MYRSFIRSFLNLTVVISTFILIVNSEGICYKETKTSKAVPANSIIYAESFSSRKCMRVEGFGIKPDSNVILDECLYRTKMSKDQQLQISSNSLNKTMLKTDAGRDEFYCLSTSSSDNLKTTLCNANNMQQSWTLKPVKGQTGQFLIEQFSSKKCLKPKSLSRGSQIQLTSCNAYQTEQIWKLYYSPPANATAITPLVGC